MYPKNIILHHSATQDNGTVSWQAIRRYHTSYRCEGRIITREQKLEIEETNTHLPSNKRKVVKAPWRDIGYHVGIENVNNDYYEVLMGRMWDEPGAHCPEKGMNRRSVGVCFIGNFDQEPPPEDQWKQGVRLVKFLMLCYHIEAECVYGHREFAVYKTCPGEAFDLQKFRADLIS